MARTRALITETERQQIAGGDDVEDIKRYQAISRVRNRIEDELVLDVELLAEHHPDLLDELREVVCAEGATQTDPRTDAAPADPVSIEEPGDGLDTERVADQTSRLDELDFPAGKDLDACIEAIHAARDYLQEHGPASKREIVSEVMPAHSLGYDVEGALEKIRAGDRYRGAWWRRIIKPGLEALPGVDSPARGQSEWKYTNGG